MTSSELANGNSAGRALNLYHKGHRFKSHSGLNLISLIPNSLDSYKIL